ncbi:pseudouridine synthase [Maribacter sp. 2304DJ31-5]|uniref:pseudouridine synthase n=1 Tax=Maribacter sp. 2304DJ31-5 TaxID=3386273 RepID=UPI0039BCEBEF
MAHSHFKLYKPFGMLSQLSSGEERQLRKKRFLSELHDFPSGTMPIGRLDEKSEGLLLMTTDGKLCNHINTSGIEKEYWAQLDGEVTSEAITRIKNGVEIGVFGKRYVTKPCRAFRLGTIPILPEPDSRLRIDTHRNSTWVKIILTEGKFRQVRKMTAAVGFPTLRLIRVRVGNIYLNHMAPGIVRKIDLKIE